MQEWQKKAQLNDNDMLFADFMQYWLQVIKNSVQPTTYYGYTQVVNHAIDGYFRERKIKLCDLKPYHIQDFYEYKLYYETTAKNTTSLRSFPLSDSMVEYLKQVKMSQDKRKANYIKYNHEWDDFVCVHDNGDLISLDYVSSAFPNLCSFPP